jgi:AbrB family looped-hinge helix DNA binding protein
MEYHIEDVTAFETGKPDSLVVVIPKAVRRMLKIQKGAKFQVKVDSQGRIILEPIKQEQLEGVPE